MHLEKMADTGGLAPHTVCDGTIQFPTGSGTLVRFSIHLKVGTLGRNFTHTYNVRSVVLSN
jgi:hypothetical protein